MSLALTEEQSTFLKILKEGRPTEPVVKVLRHRLESDFEYRDDIENIRKFITAKGGDSSNESIFSFMVDKSNVVKFLNAQKELNCLALSNCIGVDADLANGGRFMLIQKGIIWNNGLANSEYELFASVYKNSRNHRVAYQSFGKPLLIKEGKEYQKRFKSFYSKIQLKNAVTGYTLPVEALLNILEDSTVLGHTDQLKITFGLTRFYGSDLTGERLGNFSFYISDANNSGTPAYVKCRIVPNTGASMGNCPPKIPCNV